MIILGKFNLLDEPWISVILDDKGKTEEVSLKNLFENAHLYKSLAGDTKTQDFAVLRVLLAILHTIFSRLNAEGEKYEYIDLDDKFKQLDEVDEEDLDQYTEDLYNTWFDLWERKKFPKIINTYLEAWRDRFYLFDENFPFFQATKADIGPDKINKSNASEIAGKNINRLISESGNKTALFSPKQETNKNKEILTEAEIVRWLITFQGYTGLSDKVIFGTQKYKASKGWLFDLGGIYLDGKNLYETLMLNCILPYEEGGNLKSIQKPCWESASNKVIDDHLVGGNINNLASLYTAWSRAMYIEPNFEVASPFLCHIVKLPEINHQDNFLEPMTIWKYNKTGENKDTSTPRKHQLNKSMWRSFGLIALDQMEDKQRKPGIIDWLNNIKNNAEKNNKSIGKLNPLICATSMQDDGNATSWVPTDEIIDSLSVDDLLLTDLEEDGWVIRVNDEIEKTKKLVEFTYKNYISDIKQIRNISSKLFVSQKVEELYFKIDYPFRVWLSSIKPSDEKDEKLIEWDKTLKKLIIEDAEYLAFHGGPRDYMGVIVDDKVKNIATAYNRFIYNLNKELKL